MNKSQIKEEEEGTAPWRLFLGSIKKKKKKEEDVGKRGRGSVEVE